MGAALSSRAEWTSASETGGKLDFSKANVELLLDILRYVEELCRDHPREATVIFRQPFSWKSSLTMDKLEALGSSEDYEVRYKQASQFSTYYRTYRCALNRIFPLSAIQV